MDTDTLEDEDVTVVNKKIRQRLEELRLNAQQAIGMVNELLDAQASDNPPEPEDVPVHTPGQPPSRVPCFKAVGHGELSLLCVLPYEHEGPCQS